MHRLGRLVVVVVVVVLVRSAFSDERPSVDDAPAYARWLVSQGSWGVLSTLNATYPFGYVASYSDADTGIPYLFLSPAFDPAGRNALGDPRACFTLSQRAIDDCGGRDPQSPYCPKISLTGKLIILEDMNSNERDMAKKALFRDHPQFTGFPVMNGTFAVFKLQIDDIFLVNTPTKPRTLTVDEYLSNQ